MKKLLSIVSAVALAAPALWAAEMESTTVTTTSAGGTTTTGMGTVTEFTPGSALVVRTEKATSPVRYKVAEDVTYVTKTGETIEPARIKAGVPVTVHYKTVGSDMVVDRVVVEEKTTTTTTTTE